MILILFQVLDTRGDTIILRKKEHPIYELEQSLEKRKKRLDSSLKHTDFLMDSLTGNIKYTEADTLSIRYLLETKKERERDARRMFWIKVAVFSLLVILSIGFYGKQRRWWLKGKRGGEEER